MAFLFFCGNRHTALVLYSSYWSSNSYFQDNIENMITFHSVHPNEDSASFFIKWHFFRISKINSHLIIFHPSPPFSYSSISLSLFKLCLRFSPFLLQPPQLKSSLLCLLVAFLLILLSSRLNLHLLSSYVFLS